MKNKRGWIKIVEAFLSALLLIVVLVLVVNQQNSGTNTTNKAEQIYGHEELILRNIQLNYTLRSEIIGVSDSSLPMESIDDGFPLILNNTINSETPGGLVCESEICQTNDICSYWGSSKSGIYSQDVLITSNLTMYNPRKFRLFCWEK